MIEEIVLKKEYVEVIKYTCTLSYHLMSYHKPQICRYWEIECDGWFLSDLLAKKESDLR